MVAVKDKEKVEKLRGVDPTTGEVIVPFRRFRVGNVSAAIWKNGDFFSVTLQKSYKDKVGEWQNTESLGAGDLLNAAKALERCESFINGR